MNRSLILHVGAILLGGIGLFGCQAPAETQASVPPNILLIMADDLGKEWISCYGATDIETPHIDALAASGTRFLHYYSMPQCTPTRVSLLTGQYPFRHGWVNHWDVPRWGGGAHFDESLNPSLGREMKQAGYRSCIVGKWQIDDFRVEPDALRRNGFDDWCMWTGYETGQPASAERYHDPYLFTPEGSRSYEGAFGPDRFRDYLIQFMHTRRDSPLFMYYPMVLPHPPLINPPGDTAADMLGKHKAMVRYVDKLTGELVQALEAAGLRENTLIIWTTDNGTSRGISGHIATKAIKGPPESFLKRLVPGGKGQSLEAGICGPFIVSWPGRVPAGRITDALVDVTDLFPTLLDLAGAGNESDWMARHPAHQLDGRSFKALLLGQHPISPRQWIMAMGGGNHARLTEAGVENQYVFRDRVLRTQGYKLYVDARRQPAAFYDLKIDPGETQNLIDSLKNVEQQAQFELLSSLIPGFPERDADPRYHPNPPQVWDVAITAESEAWKQ